MHCCPINNVPNGSLQATKEETQEHGKEASGMPVTLSTALGQRKLCMQTPQTEFDSELFFDHGRLQRLTFAVNVCTSYNTGNSHKSFLSMSKYFLRRKKKKSSAYCSFLSKEMINKDSPVPWISIKTGTECSALIHFMQIMAVSTIRNYYCSSQYIPAPYFLVF